jgi:hypothetical protein
MDQQSPTDLTPEFITTAETHDLVAMLNKRYAASLNGKYFEVKVTAEKDGVYAQILLRNGSGSFYYPVDGRVNHADYDLSKRDAALLLLDYIDLYFDEYLKDNDIFLPIDWSDYESDGVKLQLRGQIYNLEVEKKADAFLASNGLNSEGGVLH